MNLVSIGTVYSPFPDPQGMPIQPSGASGEEGRIEIKAEYAEALQDLEGFSHLILLYHFHRCSGYSLKVKPFLDDQERGLFATRAPRRPNPIGFSVVRLTAVEAPNLYILDVDVVDGTPLLDIKPYVPAFDSRENATTGWLEEKASQAKKLKADDRFRDPR